MLLDKSCPSERAKYYPIHHRRQASLIRLSHDRGRVPRYPITTIWDSVNTWSSWRLQPFHGRLYPQIRLEMGWQL